MRIILFVHLLCVVAVLADEVTVAKDNEAAPSAVTPRKRLSGLLGLAGLHAIATFVAIKFKIVVILAIIVGAVFLGVKYTGKSLFGLGCHDSGIIHDGPGPPFSFEHGSPYSHSSFDHDGFTSPSSGYSLHPGPDASSSYPSEHYPHSASSDVALAPGTSGSFDQGGFQGDASSEYKSAGSTDIPATAGPYRRSLREASIEEQLDLGEFAFSMLGIRETACRKRFVCEMEFNARSNPILGFAFNFITRGFFSEYRTEAARKSKKFTDCERLFKECDDPDIKETSANDLIDDNDSRSLTIDANNESAPLAVPATSATPAASASAPLGKIILNRTKA